MILFLDFDGVLHPDPCFDADRMFEHVPRLALVAADFSDLRLVLTTSWRSEKTFEQLTAPLGAALAPRVIGVTPHFSSFEAPARLRPYPRQAECEQWLRANREANSEWIALDDRASLFAPDCERLIACSSAHGLDESATGRLRFALLRAQRRRATNS